MARFSCKPVLSGHTKRDGTQGVCLRAIIDRKPATIPLGFYIKPQHFDPRTGRIRADPSADLLNIEIGIAIGKANKIASEYRRDDKYLTPESFRQEFISPVNKQSFILFFESELAIRKPKIDHVTFKQHQTVLNKLRKFKPGVMFADLSVEFVQKFENVLLSKPYSNHPNTIRKTMKIIKVYLNEAKSKGIKFNNPFDFIKLREVESQKPALSFEEVGRLFKYYYSADIPGTHKRTLQYFLFSCTAGLRISDVQRVTWNNIHDNVLIFVPHKTRKADKNISIPLTAIHLSLLPKSKDHKGPIFNCYADPVSNRYLKAIAQAVDIKKNMTYHISRHTFATEFLDNGGRLETLQQLLGHSMITTTMKYVKVSVDKKRTELAQAFNNISNLDQSKPLTP